MKAIRLRILGEAVIEVDDTQITPSTSHIFALLLLLALGPKEGFTRIELMELLFEGVDAKDASHRLRQLLYKLRRIGVELEEARGGLVRITNAISNPCESVLAIDDTRVAIAAAQSDWILPHYIPPRSVTLQSWIEDLKDRLSHDIRNTLITTIRRSHSALEWDTSSRLGKTLLARDPFHLEALCMTAEAMACRGEKNEALTMLDSHILQFQNDDEAVREVRRVRSRISSIVHSGAISPLRGRETELGALLTRIALPRHGTLSVIEGVPGIGKSRLAQALGDALASRGVPLLRFVCNQQTRHIALAPFVETARRLKQMRGALGASPEFKDALQLLIQRNHDAPWPIDEAQMVTRRLAIQRALLDLIEAVTTETPMALLIDDAHLLDEASLDVLRRLGDAGQTHGFHTALFLRPGTKALSLLAQSSEILVVSLLPLSEEACRKILSDIPDVRLRTVAQIDKTVSDSGGNPFYLQLLARHEPSVRSQPLELRSLAASTYAKLDEDPRLALEISLLLDSVATLPRLQGISGLHGPRLISALRRLEQESLIRLVDGKLLGPHALLQSAIRDSIPTTVAGELHRRIASALTAECLNNANDPDLALAAIGHWLEVNEGGSALALARDCANQAVALGEPATAVRLLDSIPRDALPLHAQRTLLDDIIRLSEHARHSQVLISALRERISLSDRLQDGNSHNAELELQLIAAEHVYGVTYPSPTDRVREIASDASLSGGVRIRAVSRLLMAAFLDVNSDMATEAHERLLQIPRESGEPSLNLVWSCAALIYHTTFGSRDEALLLLAELAKNHPNPSLDRDTQMARNYAGFAAMRLGMREVARTMFVEELAFSEATAAIGMAEYSAGLLANLAIMDGDYASAERYLHRLEQIGKRRRDADNSHIPGYFSSAACVAIRRQDYGKACELLRQVEGAHASMSSPRYRAVTLALQIRIQACRGEISHPDYTELRALFERACATGGQDLIAESLWRAETVIHGPASAQARLREYLSAQRREIGPVEYDLWLGTQSDELWNEPPFIELTPTCAALPLRAP